ncbi:MAG: ATP-binding protein [Elusimicrobia bacterium]|nr:ATP-binding protein [Elusimicrobiota bacterium]
MSWALAAAALALAAALWLSRSIRRSLSEIEEVAGRLAAGDLGARARRQPPGQRRRLALALNSLAERIEADLTRLRRLEQMRKDFVANVSHELRTPLAAVKAYAETLRSGGLDDPAHRAEFVAEIERSADRMTRLVDDLLTLSALESGQREPVREPVDLMRVAAEVVASLKPLADRKQLALRLDPFRDVPTIQGDRGQLKQVLVNLVDNAIKFTPDKGAVRIWAENRPGWTTLVVQDSGCGIPESDQARIFERFYRVDKARSRELGGTGLGLAIVKHIVEAHGGGVSVASSPEGSAFRVELPARSA